ncbi:permease [Lewinella sp. IMCC34191]|uniref:permease n=1 Tax=Lewinella sp. IMCC34191 TaxID=2259172 RepID=UPI000E26FD56|nr:permease [Lewinella sp. IMCC34191]
MNPALQKTLAFLLLILAGYLLQRKLNKKDELKGVKVLILSIILPATIFVALLRVEVSRSMLLLPILALVLNAALYFASVYVLPKLGFAKDSPQLRTMLLLVPSLAPGLSAFPFILEYLGDGELALAALADVGNKVFVLVILYLVAMNWYYRQRGEQAEVPNRRGKMKELGMALLAEPVNMVILLAVAMISFGFDLSSLPLFVGDTVDRLASLMTPIVLLFIGMAVNFQKNEMALILRVLCYRSGLALVLSGLLILTMGLSGPLALLTVVFAQCAVSFWPFAHMSAVEVLRQEDTPQVFDLDLGLNVLAFSLPFSTVVILSVLSFGEWFSSPTVLFPAAAIMVLFPLAYLLRPAVRAFKADMENARA